MQFILDLPWILKVLGTLVIILTMNRFTKSLIFSMATGALTLGLISGHSLPTILHIVLERFFSLNNLLFMVIIIQVSLLSALMSKSGLMRDLVDLIQQLLSKRAAMALLPSVVGLLPVPGGALFSAPLLNDCDTHCGIKPLTKSEINYWYRHTMEFWWPLYPGVLLAMEITGLKIPHFFLFGFPLTCLYVLCGYIFILRKVPISVKKKPRAHPGDKLRFNLSVTWLMNLLELILPIIMVIVVYGLVQILFPGVAVVNKYLPMIIGLFVAFLFQQIKRPLPLNTWKKSLFQWKPFSMALLVSVISVYGAFIEARLTDGVLLVEKISIELHSYGIPVLAMMMIIPFISGLASGMDLGFVGAGLPIVISLLGKGPTLERLISTTALTYGFGYLGVMLSPVHICLIVTNEFFQTRLIHNLREVLKPAILMTGGSVILYYLLPLVVA